MRHDALEIPLTRAASRRAKRRRGQLPGHHADNDRAPVPATEVIDEAFADLSAADAPIDEPTAQPTNRSLFAQLSAQLDALDRQREQLAQLLRDVEAK